MPAEPKRFAELFNAPNVEAMYALSPREFERFVAYVLRRAGYDVKEVGPHFLHGVDLEMRLPGRSRIVGGVECKKFAPEYHVRANVVMGLMGAPVVGRPGVKPFVITTSDFKEPAHQMAEAGQKPAYLMNGSQLVRYIKYIRGSLHDDDDTIITLSPEPFCGREVLSPRIAGSATILTVANNKGGVGKTTTAYYLGAELARQGKRVLLIDLDAQANLTEWCFEDEALELNDGAEHFPSIVQYFSGPQTLQSLVRATKRERLSIIPSDPFLRLRDLGGSGRPDIEMRFARDVTKLSMQPLASLGGVPDWIIIDTPPAMSVFTRAGLAAAHSVIAPIRPRRRSLSGTRIMLRTLDTVNALTKDHAAFLGVVITHWDDLKVSQEFENLYLSPALEEYGGKSFRERIPIDNQLETLKPGANTGGAKAYKALAEEVAQ